MGCYMGICDNLSVWMGSRFTSDSCHSSPARHHEEINWWSSLNEAPIEVCDLVGWLSTAASHKN